jgi:hypothetical protein
VTGITVNPTCASVCVLATSTGNPEQVSLGLVDRQFGYGELLCSGDCGNCGVVAVPPGAKDRQSAPARGRRSVLSRVGHLVEITAVSDNTA